ncbi:hypothetical protein D9619_005785 [Psilocybe cf. subviscida]|uniref:t-SNARE coiled-coil homology domain-containing protein n=1 Tax=Psilocybe cf. subviscida TaxID=2480587 RepID=A0A8H5BVQ9_9AGAR|nr:hypothetical protein D9619_005785 [Psilocybe cf. subviscida]
MASRDRLQAIRAQRAAADNLELSSNVHHNGNPTSPSTNGALSPRDAFLAEDAAIEAEIRRMRENVLQISALRSRSLNAIDDSSQADTNRLSSLTEETRAAMQEIKARIKALEAAPATTDAQLRSNRISVLRSHFLEALQDYQREEQEGRARSRQRVERQLKIVKPDATAEEVAEAVNGGGEQIFSQALMNSTRYAESRQALREVQQRQQDIVKVEQTLAELAQLFQEMATLVEQQDVVINNVETTAQAVNVDTERGAKHTEDAVVHARAYRKKRWICFFIFVFVLVVLAIVLGIVFGKK